MVFREEIRTYSVTYYAGGKNKAGYAYRAVIGLSGGDGRLIGAAFFHRDPATMPDTDEQTATGLVWCHFTWEDYPQVLDLLRNESPVYLWYVAGGSQKGLISTLDEPIGDGEVP